MRWIVGGATARVGVYDGSCGHLPLVAAKSLGRKPSRSSGVERLTTAHLFGERCERAFHSLRIVSRDPSTSLHVAAPLLNRPVPARRGVRLYGARRPSFVSADEPRPGTTASLDRRVERIEAEVAKQGLELAVMKAEQGHLRELMQAEFRASAEGQHTMTAKLDSIVLRLDQSQVTATAAMSDPLETAAGRAIMQIVQSTVGDIGTIKRQVYMALGALAVVMVLIQIFGPAIRVAVLGA